MSFAVGYRKDYQFDRWVEIFAKAVEDGLSDSVSQATYLARLLRVSVPMTEGAPSSAAAALPRALVKQYPGPAVALFEYLVRNGTISHLEGLAELIEGFADGLAFNAESAIAICVDLVTDILATASVSAYSSTAKAIAKNCRAYLPDDKATSLLAEMQSRLERYALPSTRSGWLEGLGVSVREVLQQEADVDNYRSLHLTDGSTMSETEVSQRINNIDALFDLRARETAESSFNWSSALDRLEFTTNELIKIAAIFDRPTRHDADALVIIGQRFLRVGDKERALGCAEMALKIADQDSWSTMFGSTRRTAHMLAVASGGHLERKRAWADLADYASSNKWAADQVVQELDDIAATLEPTINNATVWPLIRGHLEGMTVALELGEEDPQVDQPVRWWTSEKSKQILRFSVDDSLIDALGILLVDHASHPAWLIRDAAIAIGSRDLERHDSSVARAINHELDEDPPDDVVEALGRMAAASSANSQTYDVLRQIHDVLGRSENEYIRSLSDSPVESHRPLPIRYQLSLPLGSTSPALGALDLELGLYEDVVRLLADLADLDQDELLGHAMYLMRQQRMSQPTTEETREALARADLKLAWPSSTLLIARSVVGRMLYDFRSGGYLVDLKIADGRLLSSFDSKLVGLRPDKRPSAMPDPPPAGIGEELSNWVEHTSDRLDEYARAVERTDGVVIAARARATVLNWGHLNEEFIYTTKIGEKSEQVNEHHADPWPVTDVLLSELSSSNLTISNHGGEDLAIVNVAWRFHQLGTNWMSFSPNIAAKLEWVPIVGAPGSWNNAVGELAVSSLRWVDGWFGHAGPAFDDSEADGMLVFATTAGAAELSRAYPALVRYSRLIREGNEGSRGQRQSARQCKFRADEVGSNVEDLERPDDDTFRKANGL